MEQINIHAAKTHLSSLIEKAAAGKPFIIAKSGKPLVTVSAYVPPAKPSRVGFLKDFTVPDDFDYMLQDEITAMFEGEGL
ncbi:MAG: type II toxin-antitoxin system prevent-host-death family antitoxin [Oscillospiraceae bacterium]|nr:type II toxin-antitoxin system prevent-host-death family antitoxin [Oscillospiraceae bacterium]